jgi:hypothetical protein
MDRGYATGTALFMEAKPAVQPVVVPQSEVRDGLTTCTRIAEDRERNPLRAAVRDLQHLDDVDFHGDDGRTVLVRLPRQVHPRGRAGRSSPSTDRRF